MSMHAVISGWLLGRHSGANKRLLGVLSHASEHLTAGERVTVLHRPEFSPPQLERINWLPINIPAGPTLKRAIREQFCVRKVLKDLQATVYDHGFLPPPRVAVPMCLMIHDLRAADGHTMWPSWLARSVLRKACRRADVIITPSEWTAQRLQGLVPAAAGKTISIPNGFTPLPAEPRPLPRTKPRNGFVLHVGHLEARKNLSVALRALATLSDDEAPELWLAGHDAGAGASLTQLARRLGITARVHHLGAVDDATLNTLYSHARAVIMPSIYEGFGMPVLEGLAYGLPVLAANATALPEVLNGRGMLLPPHQPQAWATALRAALARPCDRGANPAIAEGSRGEPRAFDWHRAAQMYVDAWRNPASAGLTASRS